MNTDGILHKYLGIVKLEFEQYFDLIFEQKYEKRIFEILFKKYINIRYYNIRQEKNYNLSLKDAVNSELGLEAEKLMQKYAKDKVENIEVIKDLSGLDRVVIAKKE